MMTTTTTEAMIDRDDPEATYARDVTPGRLVWGETGWRYVIRVTTMAGMTVIATSTTTIRARPDAVLYML